MEVKSYILTIHKTEGEKHPVMRYGMLDIELSDGSHQTFSGWVGLTIASSRKPTTFRTPEDRGETRDIDQYVELFDGVYYITIHKTMPEPEAAILEIPHIELFGTTKEED